MRNLNRIIFINSANIPYADDIFLDGNVHFIGTQGVGKSTVLRSILFFYNADTQKLGIPVEKQSYAEYYFPYANSYIVYEVTTEKGAFCILTFKSMNRICFRFIDSPYRKEFFVDENRTAYSGTDRIRAMLDQYGVDYSRIIYTYEEYRNILYGNGVEADMRKYSLMESKQFQNIPRTIQNVLLNSKLDAEFIKKTIISSLNEEETAIDLNSYKEHLKNFETRLRDIEEFRKRETRKQATDIIGYSAEVAKLKTALVQGCRELAVAFRQAQAKYPVWKEKQEKAETERNVLQNRKKELQKQSQSRCDELHDRLTILDSELQKARKKEKEYERINIHHIIERSAKKEELASRQESLEKQQHTLTSQYEETSTKYERLINGLNEEWNKIHAAKLRQKEELNQTLTKRMKDIGRQREEAVEALFHKYQELSEQLHPERSEKQNALTALRFRIETCRKEVFFKEELEELKHCIQSYTGLQMSKINRKEQAELIIKETNLKWEEERQKKERETEDALSQLQAEQQQLRPRVEELDTFLRNSKHTLQGWLKDNKKGWEDNIGKLCDESVLWQTNLSPQLSGTDDTSFYGISLNLDEVNRPIKSINDYQKEKEAGEKRLAEIAAEIQHLQQDQEKLVEQLKYKYLPVIKEQREIIRVQEYEQEKLEKQYQKDMLDLENLKQKTEEERSAQLKLLVAEEQQLKLELQRIDEKLNNLNHERTEKQQAIKQLWTEQEKEAEKELRQLVENVEHEEREEQQRIAAEKKAYRKQMDEELHSQGADTERLQQIAVQLNELKKELNFIKEHETLIIEFHKDKRDWIDHIQEWALEQEAKTSLLKQEQETLRKESNILQEQINVQEQAYQEAEKVLQKLQNDMEAYGKIESYEWYKPHQDIFTADHLTADADTQKNCSDLIEILSRTESKCNQIKNDLRKAVVLFTSHFGEDNTFKFPTKFTEDWEYLRFAEELHDFVEENRIDEFVKRINDTHSDVFKRISMDTSMLTASEDDIQDLINKVNKGFQTCNFVGVIQRIEMKIEESSNRVVSTLRNIQKYYNEHAYDLAPGTTLFSSENEQLVKQEAINLLRDFIKEIYAYRYDSIRLYDSFELRFRIVENNNDTGFVEKLSNVGSEGTDILVKAMINIMLLNVFKEGASRKFKDFKLHCMMDEIGKLHPNNVNGILKFANDRNIILINGSPTELNRDAYKHVYLMTKNAQSKTRIARLISDKKL